jgi:CubicO group peptidase (beta-lactamase class C family)
MIHHCSKAFIILLLSLLPALASAQQDSFERVSPADAGFNPDSLEKLAEFLATSGTSSMIIAYDGKILFEWGDIYHKHTIHSIRKAMLNSLYGFYVNKGVIDTSITIRELGIDDIEPGLTESEKDARIADLLKSRSGIYHDAAAEAPGMMVNKPERGSHQPGEAYYYNNWDFNALGTIFEELTEQSIYEAFYNDIARPIGMQQFIGTYESIDQSDDLPIPQTDGFYQHEPDRSIHPAYHFRMSAHDMALYGTLYMNNGRWNGRQIIPREWIEASTRSYSVTNRYMDFGYGMLWNVIDANEERASKSFFHTGVGIHMLGVYPESKLVFVHRVDTENDFSFPQSNLYRIIGMMFGAQVSK